MRGKITDIFLHYKNFSTKIQPRPTLGSIGERIGKHSGRLKGINRASFYE